MAYTKEFNSEKFKPIEETLQRMQKLEPGGKLYLDGIAAEEHHKFRWLLYDWMYHMKMKSRYKVRTLDGTIIISRLGFKKIEYRSETPELETRLKAIIEEMILSDDPIELLKLKKEQEEISPEEMGVLIDRFDKVMS